MTSITASSPQEKREFLLRLLREKQESSTGYPLSYGQRALWYLHQLDPKSAAYNEAWVWRLTSQVNVDVLRAALQTVVDRHPVLRALYAESPQGVAQRVQPSRPVNFDVTDVSDWTRDQLRQRLSHEARLPFDLENGAVFRVHLFKVSSQECMLLVAGHHIAIDLWSMVILIGECQVAYEALKRGRTPQLPAHRGQYWDFVAWQERMLNGPEGECHWRYWSQQLSGGLPELSLPTDRPRPPVQTFRGGIVPLHLNARLTRKLRELAREEQTTLFIPLLAGLYALLHRYTGDCDIIIGSRGVGRSKPEFQRVVGFFADIMPLRVDLDGEPSFRSLLAQTKTRVLEGIEHHDYPFSLLVQRLLSDRAPGRQPLCQVVIQMNAYQVDFVPGASRIEMSSTPGCMARIRTSENEAELLPLEQPIAKADLCLILYPTADSIAGWIEYNADLFEQSTIARMTGHWAGLLTAAAEDPYGQIAALPMVSQSERQQILRSWNATKSDYPNDVPVHRLFEAHVATAPHAVAVVSNGRETTYQELNDCANRLGHYLRTLGVGPETRVGVCLERSEQMLVAWLAVLKAGGAYVLLDPDYPSERLGLMLADSEAPIVLTEQKLLGALPMSKAKIVSLDREAEKISTYDSTNLAGSVGADSLAYVIYTSGSTGRPKGIAILHAAINRLVLNTNYIRFEPTDRVAQASNASFDLITFEVWGALLNGSRLIGIAKDVLLSPLDLADVLARQQVSVLILPTALFNQVASVIPTAFRTVKHLLFGGEACDPQWVRTVLQTGAPKRLLHVYGPTESTTLATAHEVKEVPEGAKTIPIGGPIANTQVYVLDAHLEPVPVGVPGELYIGGDGLARGYVNQPDLTLRCFVPDRFSTPPGARLYKTGDRARWLADGTIEFIGRRDAQVKRRGFRIELGEVEGTLGQHPSIAQAVATVREDRPGDRRLVAYVVARAGSGPVEVAELRRFLRTKLPEYMMPSAIVVLPALPLNPNGKVDRTALPVPDLRASKLSGAFVAPRTPLEKSLAQAWTEVLGVPRIGVHDNFFELGGHSLLAVRLFSRLAKILGDRPPLAVLFQAPTVAQLAEFLEKRGVTSASPLLPLRAGGSNRPFFCAPGIVGAGFALVELARHLDDDRPFYALQSRGFGDGKIHDTVEAMASDYLGAVRSIQPHGPYFLGGYSMGGSIAYEMAGQLIAEGETIALLVMIDAGCPAFLRTEKPIERSDWDVAARAIGIDLSGDLLERLVLFGPDDLSPAEFGQVLASGLVPGGFSRTEAGSVLRVLQGNFQAFWRYRPTPQRCRITYFRAMEALPSHRLGPDTGADMGWGKLVPADVQIVPGQHHTIIREPNVQALAKKLRVSFSAVEQGSL